MTIRFVPLDTDDVRKIQRGGPDANGDPAIRAVSDGEGVPCRHCLQQVEKGEEYLILSHRPFSGKHPYAEAGPIFLHAKECERAVECDEPPTMYGPERTFILRGYRRDNDWIQYDAATVVGTEDIRKTAAEILSRDDIAYLHMRSSNYNCYHCRIERA